MNYELGYFTTLSQLGLDKLAGIDSTTSLYLKLSQLSEEQLEKVAEEAGITKEAIPAFLGKILSKLPRFLGRGARLPSAAQAEAAAFKMDPSFLRGAESAGSTFAGRHPSTFFNGPRQQLWAAGQPSWAPSPRIQSQIPREVLQQPFAHRFTSVPEAPVIMGGLPRQNVPPQLNVENIRPMASTPAAAPATEGLKMPRGLKWGLGLGGAGAVGYSMFGNGGTPQPQQFYGEGVDPRVFEQYAAQGIDPRMLQ